MEKFAANAETMNAMIDAINSVVMALMPVLTPTQRQSFQQHLASLAALAEKRGETTLETMLMDTYRASTR